MLFSNRLKIVFLALGTLVGTAVCARAEFNGEVFQPPGEHLSVHSTDQRGALYGHGRNLARWHVGQWNNPSGDIPDLSSGRASNPSLDIEISSKPRLEFHIRQRGKALGCGSAVAPIEFDGLIGTNTSRNNPDLPSAEASLHLPALSHFQRLVQRIRLTVDSAAYSDEASACPVSKGVSLVCVVFTNTKNRTSLFYQVLLYAFQSRPHPGWWARGLRGGRFGYNETAAGLGAGMATVGRGQDYELDVLPDVLRVIRAGVAGMDRNAADWVISGAYFGDELYGTADLATTWSDYRLTGTWD